MKHFIRLSAPLVALLWSIGTHATPVFINEIHYDNSGIDTDEFIEVAGPAGTDLSGWSLVLYNGAGGAVYDTESLSGTIPDLDNGFGVLATNFPTNGVQNGSPDGIALVDGGGSLVQFLSYEGTFTAVGGPADGLTSTDIGVSESSSTPIGNSLQLRGTGTEYEDFGWDSEVSETLGAVNVLQSFVSSASTLVINEIDYDQDGVDTAEFFEILNVSDTSIDLDPYSVVFQNGANNSTYRTLDLPVVALGAGEYFVICGDATQVINCDLDVPGIDTNLIQNGAPDALALFLGNSLIDIVSYEGETPGFTEGTGGALSDNTGTLASMFRGISRSPDGADSDDNAFDFIRACITPGGANSTQDSGCLEPTLSQVPEPATIALLGLGLLGAACARRRRIR